MFSKKQLINQKERLRSLFHTARFMEPLRTFVLLFILAATSLTGGMITETIIERNCFDTLYETTHQGAVMVRLLLENNENRMQAITDLLSAYDPLDQERCERLMSYLHLDALISSFAIELPDGECIYTGDSPELTEHNRSFPDDSSGQLQFISNFADLDGERYAAYRMPMINGTTKLGTLYGYVRLSDLPGYFSFAAFNGACQFYLVDGRSGDFLMDTWHDSLDNLFSGSMTGRKTKKGTSTEAFSESIRNEQPDRLIFTSRTAGEDFYTYSQPVGKDHLSFQLTVPRSVAFRSADQISRVFYGFSALQLLGIAIYVMGLALATRRRLRADQEKRELAYKVNEAQRLLFGVYSNPYLLETSLELLNQAIGSEKVVLMFLKNHLVDRLYSNPGIPEEEQKRYLNKSLPTVLMQDIQKDRELKDLRYFDGKDREKIRAMQWLPWLSDPEAVRNLVVTWVLDVSHQLIGLMYVVNAANTDNAATSINRIIYSYQMSLQMSDAYTHMYQLGEFDALTGLKNRNAYQKALKMIEEIQLNDLCCIFIDVNGLREMNNRYGHASGDQLLEYIGKSIRESFGDDRSYRIGGDEFVIFTSGQGLDEVSQKIEAMEALLRKREYSVSAGVVKRVGEQSLHDMLMEAERRMYEQKRMYHESSDHLYREHNQKLESALLKKSDQENFLSAIEENYLGVYVVNLDSDLVRVIYEPSYFGEIRREMHEHFEKAIMEYGRRFVSDADYERFISFVSYENLIPELEKEQKLELRYLKKDGVSVRTQIFPTKEFSDDLKETIWIFEEGGVPQSFPDRPSFLKVLAINER